MSWKQVVVLVVCFSPLSFVYGVFALIEPICWTDLYRHEVRLCQGAKNREGERGRKKSTSVRQVTHSLGMWVRKHPICGRVLSRRKKKIYKYKRVIGRGGTCALPWKYPQSVTSLPPYGKFHVPGTAGQQDRFGLPRGCVSSMDDLNDAYVRCLRSQTSIWFASEIRTPLPPSLAPSGR